MLGREYVFGVIAIFLGLAGSVIIGELVTRILAPGWLEHRMKFLRSGQAVDAGESDLSWQVERVDGQFLRFKPNQQFRVANAEYQHSVHIDEFGGRTICSGGGDAPAQSVVLFGDSMTFGLGVQDCETFGSLLASEHRNYRILNLGVPGTALTEQLFIALKRNGEIGYARAYLFFFFLGNDYDDMIGAKPFWWEIPQESGDKRRTPTDGSSVSRHRLLESLNALSRRKPFSYSYFLQFSRTVALRAFLGGRATSVDTAFKAMFIKDAEYTNSMRTVLSQNLKYLRALVRNKGVEVLIVAIPDRYQIIERIRNSQAKYYGIDPKNLDRFLPNRILAEESAIAGIPLLDTSDCLDKRPDKLNFYYVADNHFTNAGHRAFLDCIRGPVGALLGDAR
jgi:lysophospholipase L1-like esterase